MARLLVTGGAGFIGSHTCLVLLKAGHDLIVLDDYSNSSPIALERVCALAQLDHNASKTRLKVWQGDIRDPLCLEALFSQAKSEGAPVEAVIHFAGLKAVGESVREPLRYWDVNLTGSQCLLAAMSVHDCLTTRALGTFREDSHTQAPPELQKELRRAHRLAGAIPTDPGH